MAKGSNRPIADRDRLAVDNSTSYIPVALASVAVAA